MTGLAAVTPVSPPTAWHCWRHPDVSIRSVLAVGVYAHPADVPEHEGWQVRRRVDSTGPRRVAGEEGGERVREREVAALLLIFQFLKAGQAYIDPVPPVFL